MPKAFAALIAMCALLMLAGCSRGGDWPGPVPIDAAKWDIEIDTCGVRPGFDSGQLGEGRVVNTTNERSPFYDVRYTVVYTDGHVEEYQGSNIIEPLDPGEAGDFLFALVDAKGRTVESCDIIVTDAIENYTG